MAFWYKDVFDGVTNVAVVTPPASHGIDTDGQLTVQDILNTIATPLASRASFHDKNTALSSILETIKGYEDEYCVLILTSGEALGLGPALVVWSQQHE